LLPTQKRKENQERDPREESLNTIDTKRDSKHDGDELQRKSLINGNREPKS